MLIMLVKARLRSLKSYRLDSPDDREKGLQKIAKTVGGLETFLLRHKLASEGSTTISGVV